MTPLEEVEDISELRIDVVVELDRRMMSFREILSLDVGSVIEMPRAAGENIDIYIGDALIGFGEIVVSEMVMGIRITGFRTEE